MTRLKPGAILVPGLCAACGEEAAGGAGQSEKLLSGRWGKHNATTAAGQHIQT